MIIGVNATQSIVSYGAVYQSQGVCHQWDASGIIETLPIRLHDLMQHQGPLSKAIIILGPGSYTGIRLSLTALKMLAVVHQIPIKGMSLFDGYMTLNSFQFDQLVLLTSPSRKGVVNAQLFQSDRSSYHAVSSLLQFSFEKLNDFLARFQSPILWRHFDEQCPNVDFQGQPVQLDLFHLMRVFESKDFNSNATLQPIYAYPPVLNQ